MTALLPELGSVRLRETETELVVEVDVPHELDLAHLSTRMENDVLTITLPRVRKRNRYIPGFHPEAPGV